MAQEDSYIEMMKDSLDKKIVVLSKILKANEAQKTALLNPDNVNMDEFDQTVEEKSGLIDEINELNDGFETLYEHVRETLMDENKKLGYKTQITEMQNMIRRITDLSNEVEAGEQRNKQLADSFFSKQRAHMKNGKRSATAAYNYYRNMNKLNGAPPQFIDQKN